MHKHYWLATLAVYALSFSALAQPGSSGIVADASATSVYGDKPEELAESIIIFVPAEDVPFILPGQEDKFIKGRVVSVEKGEAPGAIIRHANVLTAAMPAGVPVKLFLVRQPGQDAYYQIYSWSNYPLPQGIDAASPVAPVVTTQVLSPLGHPTHSAALQGVPYTFTAVIDIPAGVPERVADLYFGVILPDNGDAFTWVNKHGEPVLSAGMTPLIAGMDLGADRTIAIADLFGQQIEHRFTGAEPIGMYYVFTLLVTAGTSPSNSENWIEAAMSPLVVE